MDEMTQEEALRLADALVGQALKETESRCSVLAQFIDACDRAGSATAASSEAVRELRALQGYRGGLMNRRSLIQQALDFPVGESPAKVPLASTAGPERRQDSATGSDSSAAPLMRRKRWPGLRWANSAPDCCGCSC